MKENEALKSLEETLATADPRFVISIEFLRGLHRAGDLATEAVLVGLATAIASLEDRVIELETASGGDVALRELAKRRNRVLEGLKRRR